MRKRMHRLAVCAATLGLGACQASPPPASLSEEDVAAIEALVAQRDSAVRSLDWDAWRAVYADGAIVVPPRGLARGVDEMLAQTRALDLRVTGARSTVQQVDGAGDVAYLQARYSQTFSAGGGVEPYEHVGTFVWVLRKGADGPWRVVLSIWNEEPAAERPPSGTGPSTAGGSPR